MTEPVWRTLAEWTQENGSSSPHAMMEDLAVAVHELELPLSILERMQTAIIEAMQRAFQYDNKQAIHLIVLTQAMKAEGRRMHQSWGFFLIEKGMEDAAQYHIEVFLYPDGS